MGGLVNLARMLTSQGETKSPPPTDFTALMTLARGLPFVEDMVLSTFASDAPLLQEIPRYLFQLGGKRIRPLLALLVGRMCGVDVSGYSPPSETNSQLDTAQSLVTIASGIELIHLATLLHDDIIDKSPVRRKQRSAYLEYGLESSLLAGDFLLTRAFGLCARLDQRIIKATEAACVALTEGEILEVSLDRRPSTTLDDSLTVARKKTAALFELACFCGAHVAKSPDAWAMLLAECGREMGVAFQILDDVLDVTADENLLGKKSGMDLVERKPSVVNVLWLQSGSPLARRLTTPPPQDHALEEEFVRDALAELRGADSRGGAVVKQASQLARDCAERARDILLNGAKKYPVHDRAALDAIVQVIELTVARIN